jgi:hypothetical protein
MKRPFAFLLLGPASVFAAWMMYITGTVRPLRIDGLLLTMLWGMILSCFTFLVASLAMVADQFLARTLPALLRAPLTAIVGAAIPASLIFTATAGMPPQCILKTFAIGGALCTGICSLLSNEDGHPAAPGSETRPT